MMFGSNTDSNAIMHLIKEGSVGVEIGVWAGSTMRKFLKRKLLKLHLVDPWTVKHFETNLDYLERYSGLVGSNKPEDFQKYYDKIYASVLSVVKGMPNVVVNRMTSDEWFKSFDEKVDWVYVDGDHSYEGVKADINNALKIIQPGGILLGDDYKWGREQDKGGVKRAVNEFVKENNLNITQYGSNQYGIEIP